MWMRLVRFLWAMIPDTQEGSAGGMCTGRAFFIGSDDQHASREKPFQPLIRCMLVYWPAMPRSACSIRRLTM